VAGGLWRGGGIWGGCLGRGGAFKPLSGGESPSLNGVLFYEKE